MKKNHKTIAILGAATIAGLHIINRLYYSYAKSKEILNKTENNYYDWRFGKIRYQKKETVIPCCSFMIWISEVPLMNFASLPMS